jgi:hypothetical protein
MRNSVPRAPVIINEKAVADQQEQEYQNEDRHRLENRHKNIKFD